MIHRSIVECKKEIIHIIENLEDKKIIMLILNFIRGLLQ